MRLPTGRLFATPLYIACLAFINIADAKAEGLLAAWEFNADDVDGNTVRAAAGSAANTAGILQADATVVTGALSLDGDGDYLQFGDDIGDLRPAGGSMTIAAWVNSESPADGLRRIVEHEDNIYFWAEGNIFQYTTHGTPGGNNGRARSTTTTGVGIWQHVLVTFSPSGPAKIYIDGILEGTSLENQAPIPGNVQTFQIGARRSGSGNPEGFWHGLLDDIAIWDCELELADIEALAGAGGGYAARVPPTGLGGDCNGDGVPDTWYAQFQLDPCDPVVGDADADGDTLSNREEFELHTDPTEADSDGDGLDDAAESRVHNTDPTSPDSDGDGLSDGAEITLHTSDPNEPDSDGDGFDDGVEVEAGTSPNDAGSFPMIAIDAGLLLYYSFDVADIDDLTVLDRAGDTAGPFNGTLTNGGPATGVAGILGDAVEFAGGANNGDHHFVDLSPHAPAASSLTEGTIAAWVKPDALDLTTDVLTIAALSNANLGTGEMRFWVSNGGTFGTGTLAFQTRGGPRDSSIVSTGVDLFDGEWHHVAVTVDDSQTATLFVDGGANTSGSIGFLDIPGANSMSVGRNKDATAGGGQWFYDGLIDDFAVWGRALDRGEIARIHLQGLAGEPLLGPADPLRIIDISYTVNPDPRVVITWNSRPGKLYAVDFSTGLEPDGESRGWQELEDAVPSAGETTSFEDATELIGESLGFYRVREAE